MKMNKVDPSKASSVAALMAPRIALVNALMGGTETMRKAGKTLLPQYDAESDANYQYRLDRAVLLNFFRRAVEMMVGKPFSKPIQVKDFPLQLEPLIEDVDNNGNHLHVFARNVFQAALAEGITHVLVEYPDVAKESPQTLADERKLNARPYFCHIPHCSIIAAYCETVNGEERLTHVRIMETETKLVDFEEVTIERVRVLEPGTWKVWEKQDKNWSVVGEGVTSIPEIPLLTFYADREEFMIARPPLMDLANLNVAHYQSSSDQRNILTLARFPILAAAGVNDDEAKVKIGPNKLFITQSKDGKYYYVEHTGAAIGAGRQDLQDLKEEMAALSVQLIQKPGTITATEKTIDTAQSTSALQDMALRFGDFLERCFGVAAKWIGVEPPEYGSVIVNSEFGLVAADIDSLNILMQLRASKEISRKQLILELKRRSVLAEDFDADDDLEAIQQDEDRILEAEIARNEALQLNGDGTSKVPDTEEPDEPVTEEQTVV